MAVSYGARFPQYLSALMQYIWFEEDEATLIVALVGSAIVYGSYLLFLLAVVIPYLFIKAKRKHPRGFLKHLLYYCGLAKFDGYPTYFERHFVE